MARLRGPLLSGVKRARRQDAAGAALTKIGTGIGAVTVPMRPPPVRMPQDAMPAKGALLRLPGA